MSKTALFVKHKAKPGNRDAVRQVWEKYVKPRVEENPAHEAYYFCYDDNDQDRICVFQLFSDKDAVKTFMAGEWYPEYLGKVTDLVAEEPQIISAAAIWMK